MFSGFKNAVSAAPAVENQTRGKYVRESQVLFIHDSFNGASIARTMNEKVCGRKCLFSS